MKDNITVKAPFNEREEFLFHTNMILLRTLNDIESGDFFVPKHIIHNRKTGETLVIWKDGERTTVKPMEGMLESEMSHYSAFCACLAKRIYGTNSRVNRIVDMTVEPEKRVKK